MRKKYGKLNIAYAMISIMLTACLMLSGCGSYTEHVDTQAGIEFLKAESDKDADDVRLGIQEQQKKAREDVFRAQQDDLIQKFENGEENIWSYFSDIVVMGDSRAVDFLYDALLSENHVKAEIGQSVSDMGKFLDDVIELNPSYLFVNYGLNDCENSWPDDLELFRETYAAALDEYRQSLPDTVIFVMSVMPCLELGIQKIPDYAKIPQFNAAIKEMCEENGFVFVDCENLYTEHADLYDMEDGIHFTSDMFFYWAEDMIMAIMRYNEDSNLDNSSYISDESDGDEEYYEEEEYFDDDYTGDYDDGSDSSSAEEDF